MLEQNTNKSWSQFEAEQMKALSDILHLTVETTIKQKTHK
ncbi:hypothetical protein NIES4073_14230 [Kalymmatonema gypsitolerans NIES-4073]|nr:hypothetical protein NIES4073_14230 [Scytonema sp. NIES-4073]